MLVILRENIENIGRIGDVVKVSDGYARNFLLPRNLVLPADEKNTAAIEHHKKSMEKRRLARKASTEETAKQLGEFSCTIKRRVGEKDKLFGSVTAHDVADAIREAGFNLDKHSVQLEAPIKSLGVHPVTLKLEHDVITTVKVWVVKEE